MSINKLTACGRLTADPVLADAPNGAVICHFSLACDTRRKDTSGNTLTNFYRCTAWRGQAENCAKYLHKGDKVTIIGDLLMREYTDRNGQPRSSMEVDLSDIEFPPVTNSNTYSAQNISYSNDELPI